MSKYFVVLKVERDLELSSKGLTLYNKDTKTYAEIDQAEKYFKTHKGSIVFPDGSVSNVVDGLVLINRSYSKKDGLIHSKYKARTYYSIDFETELTNVEEIIYAAEEDFLKRNPGIEWAISCNIRDICRLDEEE